MRYKIEFTKPASLPANNQHLVNGFIHNLLGRNNQYHDNASNYNISSLLGGKLDMGTKTLTFKNTNPFIIISSTDAEFMSKIVMGVLQKPSLTHDCVFTDITLLSEDFKDGVNHYLTLSPILLKEVRTEMVKGKEVKRDYFNTIRDTDFSEKTQSNKPVLGFI
jgi:CRISPR/Cas system endoribonuclease Cas6 (RAMP superfamily)